MYLKRASPEKHKNELFTVTVALLLQHSLAYALRRIIQPERNNAWMRDLNHYLASPEVEFVLVGALHLPGNVGVLNQLREQGYEVEKVK